MKAAKVIVFTAKDLTALFNHDCVKCVMKSGEGDPVLILRPEKVYPSDHMTNVVLPGDIMEEMPDGLWKITRSIRNKVTL